MAIPPQNFGGIRDNVEKVEKVNNVVSDAKATLRAAVIRSRRNLSGTTRAAEAQALADHARTIVHSDNVVCAHVPVGTEPGSSVLLDRLLGLCARLLLPVARTGSGGEPLPLLWGAYVPGTLTAGTYGLLEPPGPWLPASALAEATVVLVPALAVDRRGVRLGRGGGFYDRSLALHPTGQRLVAVVRDAEVLDQVPSEAHDIRMTHALTPGQGLMELRTPLAE